MKIVILCPFSTKKRVRKKRKRGDYGGRKISEKGKSNDFQLSVVFFVSSFCENRVERFIGREKQCYTKPSMPNLVRLSQYEHFPYPHRLHTAIQYDTSIASCKLIDSSIIHCTGGETRNRGP